MLPPALMQPPAARTFALALQALPTVQTRTVIGDRKVRGFVNAAMDEEVHRREQELERQQSDDDWLMLDDNASKTTPDGASPAVTRSRSGSAGSTSSASSAASAATANLKSKLINTSSTKPKSVPRVWIGQRVDSGDGANKRKMDSNSIKENKSKKHSMAKNQSSTNNGGK